jgi:adenylate cyclase class 2
MELEIKYKTSMFPYELIETLGFVKSKESHQIDRYYIVNEILNEKRTYLRLRQDVLKENFSFDLHQIVSDIATDETEVALHNLGDILKIEKILDILGYPFVCEVDKQRTVYKKDNIKLILDKVKNLGDFIEIEIMGDETYETQNTLFQIAQQLSLEEKDRIIKKGYPDLILSKIKALKG